MSMNIEKEEKDEEPKTNPKKIKIKINHKPKNEIVMPAKLPTVSNLVQDNFDILNEMLSKELLEELTRKYGYKEDKKYSENSEDKERNVYNFIDAYRDIVKKQWNMETNFTDYRLLTSITSNPEKIKVVWGGCLQGLKRLPNESVGHIVTSPPYYNAREYSTWANLKAYLDDMREIITECYRVLDNHRVFVFNVSDVVDNDKMDKINAFGNRKIPLPAYFIVMFEECGFTFVDDVIWDKGEVQSSRHKNGNKPFPFFQYSCN